MSHRDVFTCIFICDRYNRDSYIRVNKMKQKFSRKFPQLGQIVNLDVTGSIIAGSVTIKVIDPFTNDRYFYTDDGEGYFNEISQNNLINPSGGIKYITGEIDFILPYVLNKLIQLKFENIDITNRLTDFEVKFLVEPYNPLK